MEKSEPKSFAQQSLMIFVTWFGCGKSPVAPGTVGTLGALPLVWLVAQLNPLGGMIFIFTFTVAAMLLAHMHELMTGAHDPGEVVVDEVVGFLITMLWIPFHWPNVLAAFVIFRILDILKPFPISYIDRKVKGGVGAVGDDLLAGIIGNVILHALLQNGWL